MRRLLGCAAIGLAAIVSCGDRASAQTSGASTTTGGNQNAMVNMYTSPMMNPYLNPGLGMTTTANPKDAMLYLYMSQQAQGGLLGPRQKPAKSAPRVAEMHQTGTGPTGGAGRYFNRAYSSTDNSSRYYQRPNRYFGNNGR